MSRDRGNIEMYLKNGLTVWTVLVQDWVWWRVRKHGNKPSGIIKANHVTSRFTRKIQPWYFVMRASYNITVTLF